MSKRRWGNDVAIYPEAFNDLRSLYRGGVSATGWAGAIRKEDLLRWAEFDGKTVTKVLDEIGFELASDYLADLLAWSFCDWAANGLFGAFTDLRIGSADMDEQPDLFWRFYLAFDHSETALEAEREAVARKGLKASFAL